MSREPDTSPTDVEIAFMPDHTPRMTIDRFTRSRSIGGKDAELLGAFEHSERLRGSLRKLSHAEWVGEFKAWRDAPR